MGDEMLVHDMATTEREFRHGLDFAFPEGVTARDGILRVRMDRAMQRGGG